MKYLSTRGHPERLSFRDVVASGLAPDGGLFVPETLPDLSQHVPSWQNLAYPEIASGFFKIFADDIDIGVLHELAYRAYRNFDHPELAPLKPLSDKLTVLELFHGPTLAFKDFAMQLLGQLIEYQVKMTKKSVTILGATSGDTGAAAVQGLMNKAGVNVFILYPHGRISPLQERQMTCTGAANVYPIAIDGAFDDAQYALKDVFGDATFKAETGLTTINSINIARVLAQCVYYIYAWLNLPQAVRETSNLEWVVPTGNFGNILAGWMCQKMGIPLGSFRIATNQNDILHRLFTTGKYEVESVQPSHAPSMDIQVASNFERFVYFAEQGDTAAVKKTMETFRETGSYTFKDFDPSTFTSSRTDDAEIQTIIGDVYKQHGYVIDPHTACGFKDINADKHSIILSTAHPAKFPEVVDAATGIEPKADTLETLKSKDIVNTRLAAEPEAIKAFIRKQLA